MLSCGATEVIPILKDQLILSPEEEIPFSKHILIMNLKKNMVMCPTGIRNQEWLGKSQKQATARHCTHTPTPDEGDKYVYL
jgi:hypothetical protein